MNHRREHYERPPLPGAGYLEDYTTAFLVSAGALCFVGLFAVWAVFGLPFTIVLAVLADRLIARKQT
ncbi:MAG: hypothetical protein QNJ16_13150 [Rhodobacter sp.]|nr:hypothetical protein [Rhodobacter sp.]